MSIDEKALNNVLNSLAHAVLVLEDNKIIFANTMIEKVFGWKPEDLLGKEMEMMYRNKAEFEHIRDSIYPRLEKEASYTEMYPCRHKDGRDRICNIDISRGDDQEGKKRIVLMYEDITEKMEAEKVLQENEEQYRNFIENTREIVQNMALDGKFLSANSAWYKSFGYDEKEIKELSLFGLATADFKGRLEEIFKKALSGEPVLGEEIHFTTKDNRTIILQGNFIPRTFYGKVINVRCFFDDITENRRIQEEIDTKVKELEKFNKLMVDRELKMIELKNKIKELQDQINAMKIGKT